MAMHSRRDLLTDTARGMVVAGLGYGAALDLGIAPAWAGQEAGRLKFGSLEPLVDFIATTPPEKIIQETIAKLRAGTSTRDLVAAAALANARAFGGEDYVGFHTLMALAPAWSMAQEEGNSAKAALPLLKVLYRNANRLKERGSVPDTLMPVKAAVGVAGSETGKQLRDAARAKDLALADGRFAALSGAGIDPALDALMEMVDDGAEVHRTVLVAKSLELSGFVGGANAHSLLRQSVHYCVKNEASESYKNQWRELRELVPMLLEQHGLISWTPGKMHMDRGWIQTACKSYLSGSPAAAAAAVAYALKEGVHPEDIGEALALGSNQLVLCDRGRRGREIQPGKPEGSVHGDSVGVHSGDSTHAWRAIARNGCARTRASSLILAAYQLCRDASYRGKEVQEEAPVHAKAQDAVAKVPAGKLAGALDEAIQGNDQPMAAALVLRMGETGVDPALVKGILRKWAVTEDGALHGEKYYRTACDDFASTRPEFRWRHLAGLARVTASAKGIQAPGVEEAVKILG